MNLCVITALFVILNAQSDSLIRGVYINPYQASHKEYLATIFEKADSGLINTIIVDFKSDYGFLAYPSKNKIAREIDGIKKFLDVDYLLEEAALRNIKVVARIVCFRDNYLASLEEYGILNDSGEVWEDSKGLAWTNPYQKKVRAYLVEITKEIVELGVKAIAFDYIRFPTDGELERIALTNVQGERSAPILAFLKEVNKVLDDSVEIGACIFGFAVWHPLVSEGQVISKMALHLDVLYPMLYPSHFGAGFKKEENEYWRNFWIYYDSVKEALKKVPDSVRIIPFIQGFDLRAENFDDVYISAQISGSLAAHASGFVIWHAGGNYTTSWPSLQAVRNLIQGRAALTSLNNHMKEAGQRYQGTDLPLLLTQLKSQKKIPTMDLLHSQTGSHPLKKIQQSFLDPVIP